MFGVNDKLVIGYDLSNEYAQISFSHQNEETLQMVSLIEGAEQYNIPACLFKRNGINQWFFGKDAEAYSNVEEGFMITNLLEQALIGEEVSVEETYFDPIALLTLFVKRSLSLVGDGTLKGKIAGIMFSVPNLNGRTIAVLNQLASLLDLKETPIYFQGREESIYHFQIHQAKELWKQDVMVYDFTLHNMKSYHFFQNKHTKPVVVFVEAVTHEEAVQSETATLDMVFKGIIDRTTQGKEISSAYLIGDGFAGDWCKESLRILCHNRRVFRGNNLYSKGACYSMQERLRTEREPAERIFLGKDKLKANVGMNVVRKQVASYLALLNGGENWYDSKKECDIILPLGNAFSIMITPLDGRNVKTVEVELQGLPMREEKTTRLHLTVSMEAENIVRIQVKDMGFGEIIPSTGQIFTQEITLY